MCLIIDRPAGMVIPREHLSKGLHDNPDGWGLMWASGGEVVTRKGLTSSGFWDAYDAAPPDVRLGVHFRFATHGTVSEENTHPFVTTTGYGVMHNGVISVPHLGKTESDTAAYVGRILGPWLAEYGDQGVSHAHLCEPGVRGSRLLIFSPSGAAARVNGADWVEEATGIWYSNTSYRARNWWEGRWPAVRYADSDDWSDWSTGRRTVIPSGPSPRLESSSAATRSVLVSDDKYRRGYVGVTRMLRGYERRHGLRDACSMARKMLASRKQYVVDAASDWFEAPPLGWDEAP